MEIGGEFEMSIAIQGKEKEHYPDQLFFSSGQAAIKTILTFLRDEKKIDSFLLPNYLCGSIYKPFLEMNSKVEFYNVDQSLRIDVTDLKKKLKRSEGVYILNYFNVSEPAATQEFLRNLKNEMTVIEDRTHTFFNDEKGLGHFQLASLRKWMGIPSGAAIGVEDKNDRVQLEKNMVPFNSYPLIEKRLYGAVLKEQYLQEAGGNSLKEIYLNLFKEAGEAVEKQVISLERIDPLSEMVFGTYEVEEMKKKRRENYNILYQSLSPVFGAENVVSGKLEPSDTPLGFVIYVEQRDQLKKELIKNNIYPPVHWPVVNVIKNLNMKNPSIISNKILTIPCDQRYSEEDMKRIIEVITAYCKKDGQGKEVIASLDAEGHKIKLLGGA
ncbi:hypothetical protein DHX103_03600 [Planococcus sp. X10-3]|uniref:hypothetical protein n=1 Tax=Planococcus sp. X10-3 TaxID=3061240 RepID=UPI003BB0CD45